ncbi:phosphoribosylglycinamide formyltransferase 2 [Escherichia coli]|nr:phosphoribosylglycinamide formyltransferase 2 [Escherichia coli]
MAAVVWVFALATAESVVDAIERAKHAAGQVKVQG